MSATDTIHPISDKHRWILLGAMAFVLYNFINPMRQHQDVDFWIKWCLQLKQFGLRNVYLGSTNYLPLYLYVLWMYTKLQGTAENIIGNIHHLKGFVLVFDFLAAGLIVSLVKDITKRGFYFMLLVLNPIFTYNSFLWGQIDAIHSFFLLAATVAAATKRVSWVFPLFVIALNFKLHSIIFLPLLAVLLIPYLNESVYRRKIILGLLISLFLQMAIILPFWSVGHLPRLINVIFGSVDHYPKLSLDAHNIWYWLVDTDPAITHDFIQLGPMTAKQWGLLLFFISSTILLLPVAVVNVKDLLRGESASNRHHIIDVALLTGAMVNMNFFFFCTQMHERYCHLSMIFTAAFCLRNRRWVWLILYFSAYILSQEKVFHYLAWTNYQTFIFQPRFISVIWAAFMLGMYAEIYKRLFSGRVSAMQ